MIRSTVRSAGLALLLTMNGCGSIISSKTGARTPGLNVAEAALEGGAGQIALQVSDGVLRESPNNVRALEIKGDALTLLGDYDQAGAIFQALLAKDPNSVRACIGMGRVKLAKSPIEAEQYFQRVLQADPRNVTALNNLGIARDLQGHHTQAQPAYHQALAINPDLESAQVNLALSMAMSGQGPAAIKLLHARATQPGAPAKVKHDYAVVLAMTGNRSGAERVLSDDMQPEEARQLLDSATGTQTKVTTGNDAFATAQRDDGIPPDVVQVPEVAAAPLLAGKAPRTRAASLVAPPPMVVRPRAVDQMDSEGPTVQPTNPVAAAVTNQQPLALPMRATQANPAPILRATANTSARVTAAPEVVSIPVPVPSPRVAPSQTAAANTPVPEVTPQATPRPAPTYHPVPVAQPVAPHKDAAAIVTRSAIGRTGGNSTQIASAAPTIIAAAAIAPALASPRPPAMTGTHTVSARITSAAPEAARSGGDAPTVQFAAAPSREAAQSFWQVLVHRFPDALGQRAPVVIRFEHDGSVFWRVRAEGFGSLSEAQTLCAQMRAGGQACFVPRS
jgi:Tfp pilus assembly protein PilF